jgi:hypothetical protein
MDESSEKLFYQHVTRNEVSPKLLEAAFSNRDSDFIDKAIYVCGLFVETSVSKTNDSTLATSFIESITWCLGNITCETDHQVVDPLMKMLKTLTGSVADKVILNKNDIKRALNALLWEVGNIDYVNKFVKYIGRCYSKKIVVRHLTKNILDNVNYSDVFNELKPWIKNHPSFSLG